MTEEMFHFVENDHKYEIISLMKEYSFTLFIIYFYNLFIFFFK